jgi:hypothetical protein
LAILVILVLVILWGAVLLPPILRSRAESGAPSGIGDFVGRLRMGLGHSRSHDAGLQPLQPIMGPVGGPSPSMARAPGAPGAMSPVQKRRRDVLIALLAAVVVTFLLAFLGKSMIFWGLWVISGLALGGYVFMLLQLKQKSQQRHFQSRPATPAPIPVPSNVFNLDPTRRRDLAPHVEPPRGATVIALRRTASS